MGGRAQKLISKGGPDIYADDPDALEFGYKDWSRRRGLSEAARILEGLVKPAEKSGGASAKKQKVAGPASGANS
jgi:hypothetical protein